MSVREGRVGSGGRGAAHLDLPRQARRIGADLRAIGASPLLRVIVLLVALLANVGFYLPEAPADVGGVSFPGMDKLYHVGAFALTVWAAGRLLAPRRRFPMGWVVLAGAVHAVLIEGVQAALLPHRSADAGDVLADLLGVALGLLAWWAELTRRGGGPGRGRRPADASCTRPAGRR